MPRSPVPRGAGNINMKGKKSKRMACGCCDCIDFREKVLYTEHTKDINEAIKDREDDDTQILGILRH